MVIIGIDAHKQSHTAVAIDAAGRQLATKTVPATVAGHLALVCWAADILRRSGGGQSKTAAISRNLERDLLGHGERIVRVPPKLMANARDAARTFGKSDPIDALAVARGAQREPDLPEATLTGPHARYASSSTIATPSWVSVRPDQPAALAPPRISRWLRPAGTNPRAGSWLTTVRDELASFDGIVARLAMELFG